MSELSARQQKILDFIVEAWWRGGPLPTIRAIAVEFGIKSTNGVKDHLRALEKKGAVRRKWGKQLGVVKEHPRVRAFVRQLEHEATL